MIKYWYGGLIVGASCQAIHPHTIMATEEIQMQQALKPLSMLVQDSVMSWCPCGGWLYWILSYQMKREGRSKFSYWSGIRKWLRRDLQVKISNSQTSCKQVHLKVKDLCVWESRSRGSLPRSGPNTSNFWKIFIACNFWFTYFSNRKRSPCLHSLI